VISIATIGLEASKGVIGDLHQQSYKKLFRACTSWYKPEKLGKLQE